MSGDFERGSAVGTEDVEAPAEPGPEDAWTAVAERDGTYDGLFVYAVGTTGVYCRPSCPSRRPNRDNVRFFPTPRKAEDAGFRPCRRCRPDEVGPAPAEQAVQRARAFLDDHLDEPVPLERLSREVGVSPSHLRRLFERIVGLSPKGYQDARRLQRFRERLRSGETVSRAGFGAGFGSSRAVYEKADGALGMSPGTYRRGGPGVTIWHAGANTRFGRLLVAATERGICFVSLGDAEGPLQEALIREFPAANLEEASGRLAPWVQAIVEHLHGERPDLHVSLDLDGTEFQRRVWKALREIPYGETRSYADVARTIGRPTAARAVARACATNRVPLIVPCHRVVRSDGQMGGYGLGVDLKRRLLDQERETKSK